MIIWKNLLDKNNPENTLVHLTYYGNLGEEYKCVGVLTIEQKNLIRIAFHEKNDEVVDYVDRKKRRGKGPTAFCLYK